MTKRNQVFEAIIERAVEAALAAHEGATPRPMTVVDANLDGTPRPGGSRYFVSEGLCGFAGVRIPGNTSFGRWARKNAGFTPRYGGGLYRSTNFGAQSIERGEAAAHAFAKVLTDAGIERAYVESRLD